MVTFKHSAHVDTGAGDERPCQRCIKRNLADQCHDGARKKAKYLYDAPKEALEPFQGNVYGHFGNIPNGVTAPSSSLQEATALPSAPSFLSQPQQPNYQTYGPVSDEHNQMGPPLNGVSTYRQSPSSSFTGSQQPSPMQQFPNSAQAPTSAPMDAPQQHFDTPFLDPSDPSMFEFNVSDMNFGNHYGALEFGMLGHMSSGAQANQMDPSQSPTMMPSGFRSQGYDGSQFMQARPDQAELQRMKSENNSAHWQASTTGQSIPFRNADPMSGGMDDAFAAGMQNIPPAFAIGAGPTSLSGASPASSAPDMIPSRDNPVHDSSVSNLGSSLVHRPSSAPQGYTHRPNSSSHKTKGLVKDKQQQKHRRGSNHRSATRTSDQNEPSETISRQLQSLSTAPTPSRRRRRDPTLIYSSVTQPYPYTTAFHALTAVLQRRFSQKKKLRIAKALASIRPSFISLNHTLLESDLVFMEKCFQRGLWDYEDYSNACGTPTIVCRRTGEVAHVGKEFSLLTGWSKDVLLGRAPNLNANIPNLAGDQGPASGTVTASSSRGGFNTPKGSSENAGKPEDADQSQPQRQRPSARQQPVFLAELLDEDSVVQFYEEYAKLAFADSKGSAWSPCKLLLYKTTAHESNYEPQAANGKSNDQAAGAVSGKKNKSSIISPEEGMQHRLATRDGKVECMYCWMVKRDVFNIPMMIVINVSGSCGEGLP